MDKTKSLTDIQTKELKRLIAKDQDTSQPSIHKRKATVQEASLWIGTDPRYGSVPILDPLNGDVVVMIFFG